jgi:aspartyl-tRNA(Asn)/glutamyl-tRNA(Gln) amidotransferase subunit C
VAVTQDDVRHIVDLARLGVSPSRLDDLVSELNGILAHMEVLAQVNTAEVTGESGSAGMPAASTPLRSDSSGPIPMLLPLESFAPETRDGFIIVPRLASHAILTEKGDDEGASEL